MPISRISEKTVTTRFKLIPPSFQRLAKMQPLRFQESVRLFIQEDKLLASNFPKNQVLEVVNSSGVPNII